MNKEKFLEMLEKAKEDEYGRLYVIGEYKNKIYFGTITTICEDIFKENQSAEIYDRHFWNDDTLECYVVSNKHEETVEYKEPERIKEINYQDHIGIDLSEAVCKKINELVKISNRYSELLEHNYEDD